MHVICTQDNLKKAIINSERIVSKQNTLPILNNLLLETEKGLLKIVATNLEIGIEIKIGAKVEKDGRVAVPARLLGSLIGNLVGGNNVNLELDGDNIKIKNGPTKAKIKIFPADDFPLIPQKNNNYIFKLPVGKLKDIFLKINTAVSRNEVRLELTGVNISLDQEKIFFSSTDGFRLAEYVVDLKEIDLNNDIYDKFRENNGSIIVPSNTLVELNRIIQTSSDDELVSFIIEDGQIFFELDNIKIVSRLINGKYPEYKHIMPQNYKTTILGDKKALQNALKIAGVFVGGKTNEILLKIDPQQKKVLISTQGAEVGENSTELDFEVQGDPQEISFNLKYLWEGINVINGERLIILSNTNSSPVALREVSGEGGEMNTNFTYIVMPIKN